MHDDLAAAERELRRALVLEPDNVEALGNLALVYWKSGRAEEASAAFQRIVTLEPGDAMAWNNLGVIEARSGRHASALPYFDRALALNGNLALAHRNREASLRALAASPPEAR